MRSKIALIVVLASFLVAAALGAGIAGRRPAPRHRGQPRRPTAPPSLGPGSRLLERRRRRRRRPGRPARPRLHVPADTSEAPEAPSGAAAPPRRAKPRPAAASTDGSSIGGAAGGGEQGGVVHNEGLGDGGGGVRRAAVCGAPSATGGGDQPLAAANDGGAQFDAGGSPTLGNPTTTIAPFGPAPIGVPNFVIDCFEIPPFLLPIYQACGTEYGIPWEVLASINKIETGFGTNLNVSSAGAVGWMQFLPSSWETYGLDANGDGRKDPYNPVDAICAAAHYLKVAGGAKDLYNAILAYNHADWYVQEVLLYARAYGKLPTDLVGSLTGLTEGAHFPIAADARYADDISARAALKSATPARESHRQRRRSDLLLADPPRDQHLRRRRSAGRRRQRRRHPQARQLAEARQVHRPRRHLRQPLHLRRTRQDRPQPPLGGDADRQGEAGAGRQRRTCGRGCCALPDRADESPKKPAEAQAERTV